MGDEELFAAVGRLAVAYGHLEWSICLAVPDFRFRLTGDTFDIRQAQREPFGRQLARLKDLARDHRALLGDDLADRLRALAIECSRLSNKRQQYIHALWVRDEDEEAGDRLVIRHPTAKPLSPDPEHPFVPVPVNIQDIIQLASEVEAAATLLQIELWPEIISFMPTGTPIGTGPIQWFPINT